jgi:hypothetical protein
MRARAEWGAPGWGRPDGWSANGMEGSGLLSLGRPLRYSGLANQGVIAMVWATTISESCAMKTQIGPSTGAEIA